MADQELLNNVSSVETDTATDYLEAIKQLKANSVERTEYDKLRQENKQLLDSLVNGTYTQNEEPVQRRTNEELRAVLFGKECSNLEYAKAALELRDNILTTEHKDIFVGEGHKYNPTSDDYASAQKVAEVFEECIEYSNGDNDLFTQELMRRTNDVRLPRKY